MYFFTLLGDYIYLLFSCISLGMPVGPGIIGRHWSSLVVIGCHWQSSVFRRTGLGLGVGLGRLTCFYVRNVGNCTSPHCLPRPGLA